ncbi:MAG: ATP-binding protein [Ignavibacteriaceae bacterium]
MMSDNKNILITLLLLLFSSISFSQNENYDYSYVTQPFSKYFSPKEYNANASNWCIAQDNRGIMYFGNEHGLLEYDGTSWRRIKIPYSADVRTIAVDNNGKIFITASSDFGYLNPDSVGQLQFISLKGQLDKVRKIDKEFWDVAVNPKGVFYKTADEIIRWNGKDFKIWDSVFAFRLYKIGDNIYSRNQGKGLMKIEGDSISVIPGGDYFRDTGVYDMLPLSEPGQNNPGKILITTNYSGLFNYDGEKNVPFKTDIDEFLKKNQVYNTCILKNGGIAIATQRGGVAIINRNGKLVRMLNQNSGLPTNVAYDVYPDKSGGVWIATNEGIVFSEVNSPLTIIPAEGKLRSQINSITRFKNNIYIANDIGVMVLEKGRSGFELIRGSNKPAYNLINLNGKVIAATNYGLETIQGDRFNSELDPNSIAFLSHSALYPDMIYYAGTGFFGIIKSGTDKPPSVKTFKIAADELSSVVEDSDSTLWMQQGDKFILHVTSKIKGFEEAFGSDNIQIDTYSDKNGIPGNNWHLFSFDNRFLLAADNGIFKFDHNKKSFVPDSILGAEFTTPGNIISLIQKSKKGGYWVLAEMNKHFQLGKAMLQSDGKYKWEPMPLFQRLDLNSVNDIYPDYDTVNDKEYLWISTSEGIVYFDPGKDKKLNVPFSVCIRKAIVNNDSLVFDGYKSNSENPPSVVIPYSQNDIRFEFSAASYEKTDANQYQYYLEGSDDGWSAWTTEIKKDYTNLSGGNFIFRVRAKNVYGVISTEDQFSFKVLPPWYLTWWAIAAYVLFILFCIYLTDRIMRARIIRREQDKAKLHEAELIKNQAEELETVDKLVRVINNAEDIDTLFNSLLVQTVSFIPKAEKAAVFLLDHNDNKFHIAFTLGYDIELLRSVSLSAEELNKRYTENSEEIEKGIYIISNTEDLYGDNKFSGLNKAASMLVMAVEWENKLEAYVVFDSFADKNSFDPSTARILNRFREHAVSAILKAQSIKTLQKKNEEIIKTQEQLVTQQKLASLGALTAGIAHEIKNPLNFVNNFSELSSELLDEMKAEYENDNKNGADEIYKDLKQNLGKINQHGKRADSIVKGMLLHSRGSSGEKMLTDINNLLDEYVNLAYHGMRAQDKEFNITIEKDYDETMEKINVIPQDISRVFLNITNNACYAAYDRKKKSGDDNFFPTLKVSTKNLNGKVEIRIKDNGNGIPAEILDKIFQPFFTTKPTGVGTGLGLSLSYDIVTKVHGGELKVETKEGEGTWFIILLPFNNNGID